MTHPDAHRWSSTSQKRSLIALNEPEPSEEIEMMLSTSSRQNLITILRRDLLVTASQARQIIDRGWIFIKAPIHNAILFVNRIDPDASGSFELRTSQGAIAYGDLPQGAFAHWVLTPAGAERHAAAIAEAAAEEAKTHTSTFLGFSRSAAWPDTLVATMEDGSVLPLMPADGDRADDLVMLYADIKPGDQVRFRVDRAASFQDSYAKALPSDQLCIDWILLKLT